MNFPICLYKPLLEHAQIKLNSGLPVEVYKILVEGPFSEEQVDAFNQAIVDSIHKFGGLSLLASQAGLNKNQNLGKKILYQTTLSNNLEQMISVFYNFTFDYNIDPSLLAFANFPEIDDRFFRVVRSLFLNEKQPQLSAKTWLKFLNLPDNQILSDKCLLQIKDKICSFLPDDPQIQACILFHFGDPTLLDTYKKEIQKRNTGVSLSKFLSHFSFEATIYLMQDKLNIQNPAGYGRFLLNHHPKHRKAIAEALIPYMRNFADISGVVLYLHESEKLKFAYHAMSIVKDPKGFDVLVEGGGFSSSEQEALSSFKSAYSNLSFFVAIKSPSHTNNSNNNNSGSGIHNLSLPH